MVCDVASGNAGASDWFLAARGSAGGEKEHSDALVQANCSAVSRHRGDGRHAAVRLAIDFLPTYPQKVNSGDAGTLDPHLSLGVVRSGGEGMSGELHNNRAAHYVEQAERFQSLAKMETQPRARARLVELADEYRQLADMKPRKPSPTGGWMREAAD